jgi:hypothetical protein
MSEIEASFERISEIVRQAYAAGVAAGKAQRSRTWRDRWLRWFGGGGVLVCLVLLAAVVL